MNDRRLLIRVAQLYYEHDMKQVDIKNELGVSQATVSRLLDRIKNEKDWLRIRVEAEKPYTLEHDVATKFDLDDCRVASVVRSTSSDEVRVRLGRAASDYLVEAVCGAKDTLRLGLSGGPTMLNVLKSVPQLDPEFPLEVYSSLSTFATQAKITFIDSHVIVSNLLDRVSGAVGYSLPLPPLPRVRKQRQELADAVAKTRLIKEVKAILDNKLDIFMTGVGHIGNRHEPEDLGPFLSYGLSIDPNFVKKMHDRKAIGDIAFIPFNTDGCIDHEDLARFRIGISWVAMKSMVAHGKKVALVAGGREKQHLLYQMLTTKALRGVFNVLVCDSLSAEFLLDNDEAL